MYMWESHLLDVSLVVRILENDISTMVNHLGQELITSDSTPNKTGCILPCISGPFWCGPLVWEIGHRIQWYHGICQSSATKVSFFMDNMFFDSNVVASYLRDIRPSASLFALIKFRLGGHSLRVETDRWLRPKPPREQRVCRHCSMQAVEDEQHFLFDLPFLQHH